MSRRQDSQRIRFSERPHKGFPATKPKEKNTLVPRHKRRDDLSHFLCEILKRITTGVNRIRLTCKKMELPSHISYKNYIINNLNNNPISRMMVIRFYFMINIQFKIILIKTKIIYHSITYKTLYRNNFSFLILIYYSNKL